MSVSSLRIGIDVSAALCPDTGIGRYTTELVRALARLPGERSVRLFCNAFRAPAGSPLDALPFPVVNPRIPDRLLLPAWRRLGIPPIERFLGPLDVFHTSDWVHPPQLGGASVTTVHDVGALAHPEWYAADVVDVHRRKNRDAAERADAIVFISRFTRNEFLRFHRVDPGRLHVVPNGVSARFHPVPEEEARARTRELGLASPFLLWVGSRERRKNLLGLVEIFGRVAAEEPNVELALIGMRPWEEGARVHGAAHWSGREVEDRIRELGLERRVRVLGTVPLEDLLALYTRARAFVFPSLYEGFGLPILEAMACGAPVVAADRTAVPEVVGEAGLLEDPDDPEAFAASVLRVLRDDDLVRELRGSGLERAAGFGWERCARDTLAVYEESARGASR